MLFPVTRLFLSHPHWFYLLLESLGCFSFCASGTGIAPLRG